MRRFLTTWFFYFATCALAWCSLAGVGFILMLAFMSDASPTMATYAKSVWEATLVLFVYPLLGFMVVAAVLAGVHVLIRELVVRRIGTSTRTPHQTQSPRPVAASPAAAPVPRGPRFPVVRVAGCVLLVLLGATIILGNAPKGFERDGLVPTAVTSFVFFLPLILLPCVVITRLVKSHASRAARTAATPPS